MNPPIYLDYNATTPLAPEVRDAMLPFLQGQFGNPSSSHWYGLQAKKAVEKARNQVAKLIGAAPDEIIFTSGGSEANNLALKGIFEDLSTPSHMITSAIEHPAISRVCNYLEQRGVTVSRLPVDKHGLVKLEDLKQAIKPYTRLISIMHSNNEIGTIQNIKELARLAEDVSILFHTDAAQSVGKVEIDVQELGVQLLSIAGHKLYGPKGIGALYVQRGVDLEKQIHGADHERDFRAGTENVMQIVGLGAACELASKELTRRVSHSLNLRDRLWRKLQTDCPNAFYNGHPDSRLPNTLSATFPGVEVQTLLAELDSVAASAGAACHADDITISPTLDAIGLSSAEALSTVRFSTGDMLTEEDIDLAARDICAAVERLGAGAPDPSLSDNAEEVKLTRYTHGLGCACKLRPQALEKVLSEMQTKAPPAEALIGFEHSDDAAAYKLSDDLCLVQSVDFFTPIVDRPYDFGAIAATNALSDLYAMGAKPLFALNVVGFPTNRLPLDVLREILQGASDKAEEAGISILGGHTVEDLEPKFGMSVTGTCNPDRLWKNSGAKPGDALILTKPLGLGILTTAMKRGECKGAQATEAIHVMSELNKHAADVASQFIIHSCTDITGFGLLGHLREMMLASNCTATLEFNEVPFLESARDLAQLGIIPGGSQNNLDFVADDVEFSSKLSALDHVLLADAQTSGGLLFSIPENECEHFLNPLKDVCPFGAYRIGTVSPVSKKAIIVNE